MIFTRSAAVFTVIGVLAAGCGGSAAVDTASPALSEAAPTEPGSAAAVEESAESSAFIEDDYWSAARIAALEDGKETFVRPVVDIVAAAPAPAPSPTAAPAPSPTAAPVPPAAGPLPAPSPGYPSPSEPTPSESTPSESTPSESGEPDTTLSDLEFQVIVLQVALLYNAGTISRAEVDELFTELDKAYELTEEQVAMVDEFLQQLDEVSREELAEGGFNIGDITVPSAYEVRRSLDAS